MENKKTVLIKDAYLVDLSVDDIDTDDSVIDKISDSLSSDRILSVMDKRFDLQWNGTSCLILNSTNFNSGKCSNCGQWTTDREKRDAIEGLCNGATVDDKLLCDECLPSNHRWSF